MMHLSVEQMVALLQAITCPVAVLNAQEGWPIGNTTIYDTLMAALQPVVHQTLPGSHAFHADPNHAPAVILAVQQFLEASHDEAPDKKKVAPTLAASSAANTARSPAQVKASAPVPASDATSGCCVIL